MSDIVIVAAARTPIGAFNGAFATTPAHQLGTVAIKEAVSRAGLAPEEVEEVVLGQILTAAQGQNPARQAAMAAGIPHERTALVINQLCGSGLRAVALAAQSIMAGQSRIVVAGGQESMSLAPHAQHMRQGYRINDFSLIDTMMKDGLIDAFHGYPMGITAENIAERWQITREAQDEFAAQSQARTKAAIEGGKFAAEIVPVALAGRKGDTVTIAKDEHPRPDATLETLARLKPAFKKDGTVTAGNASGLNDGAAALVLMTADEAARRGLTPLARIASFATAGVDPAIMGTGPVPAVRTALERAGWQVGDIDLIESNEAFAAQSLYVVRELGLDPARVNVRGGAIALGHPIGASGARVLVTLLYALQQEGARKGLATLCIGGGMGVAMAVEAV